MGHVQGTPSSPSVISSWTRVIVDALQDIDLDPEPTLLACGFAAEMFRNRSARLNARATAQLWRAAATRANNEAFGLVASAYVQPTTFHALGYAVTASTTLRDAMDRLVRYSRVVTDIGSLVLRADSKVAELAIEISGRDAPSFEARDAILSLIVRTCRRLTHGAFDLTSISLRRTKPRDVAAWESFYRCPVHFDGQRDALEFSAGILDRRLDGGDSELACHNDQLVLEQLSRIAMNTVVHRVRRALLELLPGDLSPQNVASKLGMSARSLQRHLHHEGTSYADLLRETRRELAASYLQDPSRSIIEIAFLLGFEDASAFARAFRSWTGLSPSEHRKSSA